MRNLLSFAIAVLLQIGISFAQGSETFFNIGAAATSYGPQTWTGDNGLLWNAVNGRTDQALTGKAMTIRDAGGNITCNAIPGGCGTLTFNYVRAFTTGSPVVQLYINGSPYGSTFTSTSATLQNTGAIAVNAAAPFNLEIRQTAAGASNRMIIDDIVWTASGPACTPPGTQASGASINAITSSSSDTNWTPGASTNSLVVIKQGSAQTL